MKNSFALLPILACLAAPACVQVEMGEDEAVQIEEGGQVSLEWLILADDDLVSCVDAGASEVELAIIGDTETRHLTSCYGGFAIVEALEAGSHLVEVSLVGPDGSRIVTADLGEIEVVQGATVPLGAVEFSL